MHDRPIFLAAADGLVARIAHGALRIEWDEPDWLGPAAVDAIGGPEPGEDDLGRFTAVHLLPVDAPPGVVGTLRAYADEPLLVLRLEAERDLAGLATGSFAVPSAGWCFRPGDRADDGVAEGTRGFGHQHSEFAWPTTSDAGLSRWFLLPHRPAVVEPLWLLAPDDRVLLLAPLDAYHDQVIGVPTEPGGALACGWHGDLETVPAGFATELALWGGAGTRAVLDRWAGTLRRRAGTVRPSLEADALGTRLSYWTDNGAAYWYRTEAGADVTATLTATVDDLRARDIPVAAVQLDSWFYPHEVLRPFDTDAWVVPPTGLVRWEAREDILPDGLPALRTALGDPPLVAHCRHLSSASPHVERVDCWVDGDRAHPIGPELYERWLDSAQAWGVETFEHDWLVECFLGVRGLRAAPGRARAWQEGLDRAARERGITLQWCMASPADFAQTTTLTSVTSIRTSGDHGYLTGPGVLWAWFLHTSALARALGLAPFKDVFRSDPSVPGHHAEVEALLSALSTGPVGLGDPLGTADRDIARRTCRADGVLVRPDVPMAAVDRCYARHPVTRPTPLVGEAWTDHPAGRWTYALALNVFRGDQVLAERIPLADLGAAAPTGPVAAWDWRRGTLERLEPDGALDVDLEPLDWRYVVLAPVVDGVAVVGDPTVYASGGRRRLASVRAGESGLVATVLGVGEVVPLVGWAEVEPRVERWDTGAASELAVDWDADSGRWRVEVGVGGSGWAEVRVRRRATDC